MTFSGGAIYLLLVAACGAAVACDECSAVFELLTSGCPTAPIATAAAAVAISEAECVLRCTLSCQCRLFAYLRDSAACYSLPAQTSLSGICGSGMVVRRKLLTESTAVFSFSFSPQISLFYNFKRGFMNLVDQSQYAAQPVNISEQNCIDGVRLRGSSSSYVRVSTPGFYKNFFFGQSFSIFFQGKFASDAVDKCISTFANINSNVYSSDTYAQSDGRILSKIFFPNGTVLYKQIVTNAALSLDSVQRVVALGLNFEGDKFASQAYFNGSPLGTAYSSQGPRNSNQSMLNIHDELLIGKCKIGGVQPFDGWLQCWALLTGNLGLSQFDQLRSLCGS